MATALVRGVPATFDRAIASAPARIDVERARAQHAAYVAALASLGVEIRALPADDACPDCCFVEDTAVAAGGRILLCRPAPASRKPEVDAVAAALVGRDAHRAEAPATIEGGDCMRLGKAIYVGRSARTNDAGIARLGEVFGGFDVRPVELPPGVLHLKSVCSPVGDDLVLLAPGTLPPQTFAGARVLVVPEGEAHAANAVAHAGAAIVAAGAPRARELVERAGFRTVAVDTSELRKADGALTCLSVLIEP